MKNFLDTKLTRPAAILWMSVLQFLSDLTLSLYVYSTFKNSQISFFLGEEFKQSNFHEQIFKLMLMGLYFLIFVFLVTQLILYLYLNLTYSKAALFYFKIYAVFGFTISLYSIFYFSGFALLNMLAYLAGYYIFARELRLTKEQGQIPSLLAKLRLKK